MESARLKALLRFSINLPLPGILAGVESYGMAIEDLPAVIAVQYHQSATRGGILDSLWSTGSSRYPGLPGIQGNPRTRTEFC